MKRAILLLMIVFVAMGAHAQNGGRAQRVQAIKIGYITQRLHLTEEQAKNFWPVYNSYEEELRSARRAFVQKHPEARAHDTSVKSSQYIDDQLALQQQALDIRKKYKDRLLKVITTDQLATLYDAERDFRNLLMDQLMKKKGIK